MPYVKVQSTDIADKVRDKTLKDLFWYDPVVKKMLKFQGTRLEFDYKYDEQLAERGYNKSKCYRLIPRVVVAKETVKVKQRDSRHIMRWFRDFKNYNDSEAEILPSSAKKDSVMFEVPDNELDSFLEDLDSNSFKYEVL